MPNNIICAVFGVEAFRIHRVLAHLLLHLEQSRVERTGHRHARLDARRNEADQVAINGGALVERRHCVGVRPDPLAHSFGINPGRQRHWGFLEDEKNTGNSGDLPGLSEAALR
jgi:hypothetical protein